MPAYSHLPLKSHDINGDSISDIAWRDGPRQYCDLADERPNHSINGLVRHVPGQWSIVGQRDFNGDGNADLLWRDTSGNIAIWFMNGTQIVSTASLGNVPTNWQIVGTGDFNGDGFGDILWRDASGNMAVWLMQGSTVFRTGSLGKRRRIGPSPASGTSTATAMPTSCGSDTMGGNVAIWHMNGTSMLQSEQPRRQLASQLVDQAEPATSTARAGATFSGGTPIGRGDDLVDGGSMAAAIRTLSSVTFPSQWTVAQTGDYNGDGMSDISADRRQRRNFVDEWHHGVSAANSFVSNVPGQWSIQRLAAE